MQYSVAQIASALNARLEGRDDLTVRGAAEPSLAGPEDLAMAATPEYAERLSDGRARAALLWEGADWRALGLEAALFVARPRYALAGLTAMLDPGPDFGDDIHPSAVVDPSADLGEGACVAPLAVVGPGAVVGPRARIGPHASVAAGAVLGADALLHAGARIGRNVRIGDRFIAQPGAVVGGDGFSFVTPEKSGVEAARETLGDRQGLTADRWVRIHSLGGVVIGDDVEIGANSCIDAGTLRPTRIGTGCKIDNLVQVGHNVEMGDHCLMAGMSGIAGSTRVGDRVVFGGNANVADNLLIGDDAILAGGSKVASNVPAGRVMMGYPAVQMHQHVEIYKALRRLPRFMRDAMARQKAVSKGGAKD
ncbi:UDP-3-O-(3-hydroxymyristoyl)glucosamine N-acyltransferase [Rhodobacteraceae bacterium CCMM004]|nr:UDP-3-O-(3-hydroxymyristoyl)glucosamine N-acyltransferase [Rhodobacteraceae bacterium CCMM004]